MRTLQVFAVALFVAGVATTSAQRDQVPSLFAGKWAIDVDGTGPLAGTGTLDLRVDGPTVTGTLTTAQATRNVKGEITDSLRVYTEDGAYFLGSISNNELSGTHVFTMDGKRWKTGWRGKRPAR
jgi:hypothetical protein